MVGGYLNRFYYKYFNYVGGGFGNGIITEEKRMYNIKSN